MHYFHPLLTSPSYLHAPIKSSTALLTDEVVMSEDTKKSAFCSQRFLEKVKTTQGTSERLRSIDTSPLYLEVGVRRGGGEMKV